MKDRPAADLLPEASDQALRVELLALKTSAAEVDALGDRVFAQWRELHSESASATTTLDNSGGATALGGHASRRRRWVGVTTGLLIGAVIATVVWVQRPDPALDELMQADVLSQMAIGEL